MVGTSRTSAPRSSSWPASWLACSRVRVTTMRRPNNERRSNQFNFERNLTTSPITATAGADSFASAASPAMVASVPSRDCCRPSVPQRTIATGVSGDMPWATSCSAIGPMRSAPIITTLVPGVRAICRQSTLLAYFFESSCPVITVKLEQCSR